MERRGCTVLSACLTRQLLGALLSFSKRHQKDAFSRTPDVLEKSKQRVQDEHIGRFGTTKPSKLLPQPRRKAAGDG